MRTYRNSASISPVFYTWCLIFLCLLGPFFSYAQEVPQIISYERSDYQAAHQNWMISQDCNGLIYVANSDGLLIYNGIHWQKILMPNRQRPRALYLGDDCKMYTGGFEFFGFIDNSLRSQPTFVSLSDSVLDSSNQEIWNIMGIGERIVFQSFSNIYSYSQKDGISSIQTPSNIMLGSAIEDQIYVPRIEQGVYQLRGKNLEFIEGSLQMPVKSKIASIAKGKGATEILIGTQYNGLFYLNDDAFKRVESELNDQLKKEQINKILALTNGDYAIGTILNGLYITDGKLNIKYHLNKGNGLTNNTVLSLFQDKVGDLWVGMDKGINLIKLQNDNRFYYDRKGELGSIFTSIVYKDQLYLGTNQGLFRQMENGVYELIDNSQGQTWSLLEVDGDLLIGHNNGTFQLVDDKFIKICEETGGWAMTAVRSNLVLQSTYNGLLTLEKLSGMWQLRSKLKNGGLQISKFRLDGNILMGHFPNYGISILSLDDDYTEVLSQIKLTEIEHISLLDELTFTLPPEPTGIVIGNEVFSLIGQDLKIVSPEKKSNFKKSLQFHNLLANITTQYLATNTYFINYSQYPENLLVGIDDGYMLVSQDVMETDNSSVKLDYCLINGHEFKGNSTEFNPNENDLTIQLASGGYDIAQNLGEYRLEGWDANYYQIPKNGKLEFLNLDDGEYKLQIRGHEMKEKQMLSFSISPHWYESSTGYLIYVLLGLVLIYVINKIVQRHYKKEQQALIEEQQKELETARMKARNENLEKEIVYKSKMLANSALALAQKNKLLGELRSVIQKETAGEVTNSFPKNKIYKLIDRNINSDSDWEIFERNFAAVHKNFLDQLKEICPEISTGELKLAAYIKMNLASKEIAPLLNISVRSIENKRYRLRKKLGVDKEKSLKEFLMML